MGLNSLGGLAIHIILSKLVPKETAIVACVSQRFRVWASDESLWAKFCAEELHLSSPEDPLGNPTPPFQAAYQAWREAFGMYPWFLVVRAKRCWDRLKSWLSVNFPEVVTTLRKGATEDAIKELEKSLKVKLPLPTRVLYRLCDGQESAREEISENLFGSTLGLIGGYSFYDHAVDVFLLPLKQVIRETKDIIHHLGFSNRSKSFVVAASSTRSKKIFFLDCNNGQLYVGTKNLSTDGEMIPCVPNALICSVHDARGSQQQDAMLLWLEEHGRRLESGVIKVKEEENVRSISLFPEQPSLCSTAITNGVQVRASAVLVPELSDLQSESKKYLFIYSIRMSLLPEGCVVNGKYFSSCQLYWRRWIVRDNDNVVSHKNGEAVIGKFPLLRRGVKEFLYQSCTTQSCSRGSMEGSFTFVPGRLRDPKGNEFEVEVARFPVQFPDYIF